MSGIPCLVHGVSFKLKPAKKVGTFCWLSLAIFIVELLICIKFGHEDDNLKVTTVGQCPEGDTATTNNYERCEKPDKKPARQRLLVVANRLPVSAVRKGEDVWHLEISAGGLVSALLDSDSFIRALELPQV